MSFIACTPTSTVRSHDRPHLGARGCWWGAMTGLTRVRLAWKGDPPVGLFARKAGSHNCDACRSNSKVTHTIVLASGDIQRTRKCPDCGQRWQTAEITFQREPRKDDEE